MPSSWVWPGRPGDTRTDPLDRARAEPVRPTPFAHGRTRREPFPFSFPVSRRQVSLNGLDERTAGNIRSAVENHTEPGAGRAPPAPGLRERRRGRAESTGEGSDSAAGLQARGFRGERGKGSFAGDGSGVRSREGTVRAGSLGEGGHDAEGGGAIGRRSPERRGRGTRALSRYSPPPGKVELEIFGRKVASFGEVRDGEEQANGRPRLVVSVTPQGFHRARCRVWPGASSVFLPRKSALSLAQWVSKARAGTRPNLCSTVARWTRAPRTTGVSCRGEGSGGVGGGALA